MKSAYGFALIRKERDWRHFLDLHKPEVVPVSVPEFPFAAKVLAGWKTELRYVKALSAAQLQRLLDQLLGLPACKKCGCTEHSACDGGCSWSEKHPGLCTSCEPKKRRKK